MNQMKDQVVVITGASAGVGRATARLFAKEGAKVALLARGREGLAGAHREMTGAGAKTLSIAVDVAHSEEIEQAAIRIERELGPIDVWINNAMVSLFSPFKEMTADEFERVTDVTYLGTVYGTLAALRRMNKRNRGTIIQVGSALAYRGIPLQSAYCGAKHGINGFTESLRCELLHDHSNVKLCTVQLPALNTPQFSWVRSRLSRKSQPVPPIYQPEVAAKAILWAARHQKREVYVGFSALKAIWADKVTPGLLDRYLSKRGYSSQQTSEPRDPDQPDNLMVPVPGDFGAHGRFDDRSKDLNEVRLQLWLSLHQKLIASCACALAAFIFWVSGRDSGRS